MKIIKLDGERSADEERWGMSRVELEKRILRLYRDGTGELKIGKALRIGTGKVQRVLMEQPRPFDVAEAAFASHVNGRSKAARVPGGVVRGG